MQKRVLKDYIIISLKGIAMGAADIVPGVSGGTIAFISGIYEELITSINNIDVKLIKLFKSEGFKAVWNRVNGNFLLSLIIGIGISLVSLAKLISWLLENEPILLWSFFFGLVLASVIFIGKQIKKWNLVSILLLIVAAFSAYFITTLQPLVTEETSPLYLFFAGMLAICAMILPGISGSFILVILGAYKPVLAALDNRDYKIILIFASGAVIGLLAFSRIVKWLFDHYKNATLAVLTGFVLGSLNKIWPWKEVLTTRINSHGKEVTVNDISISPFAFEGENQLVFAIMLAIVGFLVILVLEKIAVINK